MAEFRTTEACDEAIKHVMEHLWDRGEQELELHGLDRQQVANQIVLWRRQGRLTVAGWADDVPIFIAGMNPSDDPEIMHTWFLATPSGFRENIVAISRTMRRNIGVVADTYNLSAVEIFSACIHPETGRWFRTLGFEFDVHYHVFTPTKNRIYRFVRRFDRDASRVLQQAQAA